MSLYWMQKLARGAPTGKTEVSLQPYDSGFAKGLDGYADASIQPTDKMFTITRGGEKVGVIGYAPATVAKDTGFIKVVVAPEHRGEGIYREALRVAHKTFPSRLFATVSTSNKGSIAAHRSLGFTELSRDRLAYLRSIRRLEAKQTRFEAPMEKTAGIPATLYHGSPQDLDELKAPDKKTGIFLTTQPGLGVPFIVQRGDVGKHGKLRFGKKIWETLPPGSMAIPKKITILADRPPEKKTGVSTGFIYAVDVRGLEGKIKASPDEPREMIYHGLSLPISSKTAVKVRWNVEVGRIDNRRGTKTPKLEKTAGHWRRLKPQEKGKDEAGTPIPGRTWVHRDLTLKSAKPMEHQVDFDAAMEQQLGGKGGGGIIAAHGTGTGKTFTAIGAFEKLKGEGKAKRALVVTPAGLRSNFLLKGVQKFTSSKGVILTQPQELPEDVEYAIVSYDAFRNDPDGWVAALKPDTIIADEVHRASNPESKNYKALREAREDVPKFMGLTGSVVQNRPEELIPLLDLATGGEQTIKTEKQFKQHHVERRPSGLRGIFGGKTYEENLVGVAKLRASVGGTIHYVEDLDASQKPVKEVENIDVPMSSQQIQLYHDSMQGIDPVVRKKIAEGQPVSQNQAMNVFTRLMRARQVSNSLHLAVPDMDAAAAAEATPKIKRILDDAAEHLNTTPDGQIIMYSNLVHGGIDVLEAGLQKRGISYGLFVGRGVEGVTEETRQRAVEDYLASKNRVILITGAGAEGLSLGNTTMVQLVDGHYNPERIAQAEARGIRAGGLSQRPIEKRRVQVRRYVSTLPKTIWQTVTFQDPERSVEQWVYLTAEKKRRLNEQLRGVLAGRSDYEKKRRESPMFRWFGGRP